MINFRKCSRSVNAVAYLDLPVFLLVYRENFVFEINLSLSS